MVRAHRLVTLTGVGGSGKTRLALATAADVAAEFSDGVFFVDLAPIADSGRVAGAVSEAMSLRVVIETGDNSLVVARLAAARNALLLIDNCEHLLDEVAEFVEEVLVTGTAARVLTTSREALAVEGEHQWRVPSLSVDGPASPASRTAPRPRRRGQRVVRVG